MAMGKKRSWGIYKMPQDSMERQRSPELEEIGPKVKETGDQMKTLSSLSGMDTEGLFKKTKKKFMGLDLDRY